MSRKFHQFLTVLAAVIAMVATFGGTASADRGGTKLFLNSAVAVDVPAGRVTLPLHRGVSHGQPVWYVLTESSNKKDAETRGLNFSEKLANALGTAAVQNGKWTAAGLDFTDTVDFSPARVVVPGATGFPPTVAIPGAVGIGRYSPLVTTDGRTVYNATHVANGSGLHDAVVAIDYQRRTVTLDTFNGFYDDKRVQYLHQEASVTLIAAIEGSTYAPNLNAAPRVADQDKDTSARAALFPIVNGPLGVANPQRQGLQSALLGQGDPLNIISEIPDGGDYSPMWDIHPALWTTAAINAGEREQVTSDEQLINLIEHGLLVSAGVGPHNPEFGGIRALPGISNCPVVIELNR